MKSNAECAKRISLRSKAGDIVVKHEEIRRIIEVLLEQIEEEDIGISLLSTHYQSPRELSFFKPGDRERVEKILKKLSADSQRHKQIIERVVSLLSQKMKSAGGRHGK